MTTEQWNELVTCLRELVPTAPESPARSHATALLEKIAASRVKLGVADADDWVLQTKEGDNKTKMYASPCGNYKAVVYITDLTELWAGARLLHRCGSLADAVEQARRHASGQKRLGEQ